MSRNSYSLSNRSARRRKMMIHLQQDQVECSEVQRDATPSNSSRKSGKLNGTSSHSDSRSSLEFALLQKRIEQKETMRWVFAGDSESCSTFNSQKTFLREIEDYTKSKLHRDSDIFVNATYAGARLDHVRKRIQIRFSQFQPEVVIVMCGFAECQSGVEKCSDFEMSFIALLKDIEKVGAIPIVCTPPHSDVSAEAEGHIDRLIFIEAIRGCVVEHSGLLIDFWADWENQSDSEKFWDAANLRPTPAGLQRMKKFFLSQLDLLQPENASAQKVRKSLQTSQES
ncbi:hypothetical protein OAF42_03850 [Planctomicrobium sp.]|nr:hypothetical protein [Planctomicrobium sp.]MDB4733558.1 hypothetical protein [Planctomicrobium sp.]